MVEFGDYIFIEKEKEQMEKAWCESESVEWCDDGFDGFFEQTYSAK